MKTVQAVVRTGHRVASGQSTSDTRFPLGTIRMQEPFFKERGLDLAAFFGGDFIRGTLNLSISPLSFKIAKPEYFFEQVKWADLFPPENFFMSPVKVLFGGKEHQGMIYIPDPATKPDHFQDPSIIEVLAEKIEGLNYGDTVSLLYNPEAIEIFEH